MSSVQLPEQVSFDNALAHLVNMLKSPPQLVSGGYSTYGYGIYLPNVIGHYLQTVVGIANGHEQRNLISRLSPVFLNAAWELCRKGIIRPGVMSAYLQTTEEGNGGGGYSLTDYGKQWLKDGATFLETVPLEQGRFVAMLDVHAARFGPAFRERAHEAYRCHFAHAYLACCAMCGAAAEAVMLATAVSKKGDESAIVSKYNGARGRSRVESYLISNVNDHLKRDFAGFTYLLKYWRDDAAHGKASLISENEAFSALAMLLRFAHFVDANWADLTTA